MINRKDFEEIGKELDEFEEQREKVIALSREILKLSKLTIYSLQRNDLKSAEKSSAQMTAAFKKLPKDLYDAGIQKVAVQEYVEAMTLLHLMKGSSLPTRKMLEVESEDYLMGLCDLTGELVRKAVQDVTHDRPDDAKKIHSFVDELYGEFLKFNPRNGELRKKIDSIKWNLKKLDEVAYDLKMRRTSVEK